MQAAPDHRLRAEPVAAAQDHGDERDAQRGAGDEQPRGAAHERLGLGLRPDHVPRGVDERDDRQAEGIAELQEARRLVGCRGRDRAGHDDGVVGDDPHRPAFDAGQGGDHLGREALAQERHRSLVGQRLDDRRDLVGAALALGNELAHPCLVGCGAGRRGPWK